MANIIIQKSNRNNTYEIQKVYGYYSESSNKASTANYANNSDQLDGYHASQFLNSSTINQQYIYPIYTYSFSIPWVSGSTTKEGQLSYTVPSSSAYILTSLSNPTGIINTNEIMVTGTPVLAISNSTTDLSLSVQKYIICFKSQIVLTLNTTNQIKMSNVDSIVKLWIDTYTHSVRVYKNENSYLITVYTTNKDDFFSYQRASSASKAVSSTTYGMNTTIPTTNVFINQTQQYGTAKKVSEALYN